MNIRRRSVYLIGGIALLPPLILVAAALLLRGPVEARIKAEIGRGVAARVDWRAVGLGLFPDFPDVTLRMDGLTVVGVDRFRGDTLAAVERSRVVLDAGSVLRGVRGKGPIVIRSVELRGPDLRLRVLEDGAANWDIVRPRDRARGDTASTLELKLERLELRDGRVALDNRRTGLEASLAGLRHDLTGDFGKRRFALSSRTAADSVSLRFGGLPWLSRARMSIAAALDVDLGARRFTVRDAAIRLNELSVAIEGSVAAAQDSLALDLSFRAPSTDFRHILSLVPAVYARDFATLQTSGTMSLSGQVRGGYGERAFPALALRGTVAGGTFRYPSLPLPARDIALELSVANPGGDLDRTEIRVDRFHAVLGKHPIDGSLTVRTPVSNPDLALGVDGTLDLADLPRTLKLEGIEELAGVVVAHASMRARRSDVAARRYDRLDAAGTVAVQGLAVRSADLPQPVRVAQAGLRLSPRQAELTSFRGTAGKSDITASGSLENVAGFLLFDEVLRGRARVTSDRVYLDEWRSKDELKAIPVPANVDFRLEASAGRVAFGGLELRNARGGLHVHDRRVELKDLRLETLGGAVGMSGFYETVDPAKPLFDVDLELSDLDLPSAFAGVRTVQALAPVARYAQGRVSAVLRASGALGPDMMPVLEVITGLGSLRTKDLVLRDFPALDRLADALQIDQLRSPGFRDLKSSFEIRDGRLHVKPFDTSIGPIALTVAGSNGIDKTLAYDLALRLPRSALAGGANRAVTAVIDRTARAGLDPQALDTVTLGVRITGTVTDPSLATSFRETTRSGARAIEQALREQADQRKEAVQAKVDSAAEAAKARARAEATRLLAEAEERAAAIRAEARTLAEAARAEAVERADSLAARARTPVARAAARVAADRLRKEADARAARIVSEADARAEAVLAEARKKAGT